MKHRASAQRRNASRWLLTSGFVALSAGFFVILATSLLGVSRTVAFDDYACVIAPLVAALACLRAGRRAERGSRRAWLLLGLSSLSWASGGAVWTLYEVHLGQEVPFPSLADVGYLLAVPIAVAAVLSFPSPRAPGVTRLRPLLDGVIAAGALLYVSWTAVLGPAFRANSGTLLVEFLTLAYPVGDVVIATIALLAVGRARGDRRVVMSLIGAGLLVLAIADSGFAWFSARGAYASGNLFDTGYVVGYLMIALAALVMRRQPADVEREPVKVVPPNRLSMILPYVPLVLSMPILVARELQGKPLDAFAFYLFVVVISAILARQLLSVQINMALSRELNNTVTILRDREVQLHHQAFHDPLTGLANRALFNDRVDHALARTARQPGTVIMLLADLDDFKAVNDTLGHPAGDMLLASAAERLRAVVRPGDTVARLGGDEFAVLLEPSDGLGDARQVAERISQAFVQPFNLSGVQASVGVSIGIAVADTDGISEAESGERLLRDADIAMYAAKADGKGRYTVYAAEMADANVGLLELKGDLSEALAKGQLSLKYQPIVDVPTGALIGVEALLRWTHPTQGNVPPDRFIPLAEANGAILPIGRWVITQAIAQAARWHRIAGAPAIQLAVNVSGRQLADPGLVPTVRAALASAGLDPHRLTMEITESVPLDDDETTAGQMHALHAMGVRLAMDDFGTGQSSLSRLRGYPVHTLKIDQSFVAELRMDAPVPDVFVTTILALGQGLRMNVVAEGVETEDQLSVLRELGCPQAQGYLFARPADPDVISELLRAGIALADPAVSLH